MAQYDVAIIGAGAAGLFCAAQAGQRGRRVLLIEHGGKPGEKIRISGGGRCNFTNLHAAPAQFLSANPHFCVSALKRYGPRDFIALVERHGIAYHEKTLGQLFCDGRSRQIIDMLLAECERAGVTLWLDTAVEKIERAAHGFRLATSRGDIEVPKLVIATGGKSIPKIGATGFGYEVARQFGLPLIEPRAGLVPLRFSEAMRASFGALSGISVDAEVRCGKTAFREGLLFTHRGLSGPSILQISSYWRPGEEIVVNLAPDQDVAAYLARAKRAHGKQQLSTALGALFPKRLAAHLAGENAEMRLADLGDKKLQAVAAAINAWHVLPQGHEGYRTAEVTLGGVDTAALSSKTMMAKDAPGLYFIGEVVDVTGHLGGYNFQWAWASAYACAQDL